MNGLVGGQRRATAHARTTRKPSSSKLAPTARPDGGVVVDEQDERAARRPARATSHRHPRLTTSQSRAPVVAGRHTRDRAPGPQVIRASRAPSFAADDVPAPPPATMSPGPWSALIVSLPAPPSIEVGTAAPDDAVVAGVAREDVVALPSVELVVTGPAVEVVVAGAAVEAVGASEPLDLVVAAEAEEPIGAGRADDAIGTGRAGTLL